MIGGCRSDPVGGSGGRGLPDSGGLQGGVQAVESRLWNPGGGAGDGSNARGGAGAVGGGAETACVLSGRE